MTGRQCYHCKQWVEASAEHDCWTTFEADLTRDLSDEVESRPSPTGSKTHTDSPASLP